MITAFVGGYLATRPTRRIELEHTPVPHEPIMISDDREFTAVGAESGCACVRKGSGSEQDPYVISGWVLNGTERVNAVTVFRTTVHFTVSQVVIWGDQLSTGIYFERVENARIEHSRITGNFVGVYAYLSRNVVFVNNTVENGDYGIKLQASNDNVISSNSFRTIKSVAIFVRGSSNSVTGNNVSEGAFGGINIDGTAGPANKNLVEGNTVSGSSTYGIAVWRGASNSIRRNVVTYSKGLGIALTEDSTNNLVERNLVTESEADGIIINEGSTSNVIRGNTAKGNGDGVQYFDLRDRTGGNVWEDNTYETKNPENLG